jgi:hypothetical protein
MSGETLQLAQKWLHDYDHNPARSTAPSPEQCPSSRLLKIGDIHNIPYLRLTNPQKYERYAALSYCWGGGMEQDPNLYTATAKTLAHGYSGISFSELPLTLKDAVIVTQRLGIQYLWIDRLCIVQDDDEDLSRELGKMPAIYGSAYVTICAASAANSTAGFLGPRYEKVVEEETIQLRFRAFTERPNFTAEEDIETTTANKIGTIQLQPIKIGHDAASELVEPIQKRAWTMQEHLLSHKLLVFGSRQLRWICGTFQLTDGGRNDEDMLLPFPFLSVNKASPFHTIPAVRPDPITTRYSWDALVLEFTTRQLSMLDEKPEGKLNALGGLATRFAELLEYPFEDYLAGMWRYNLVSQLLWTSQCDDVRKRPKRYRAPSWSWASVDSRIDFTGYRFSDYQFGYKDDYGVRPRVVEVNCVPISTLNPFGAVKSGLLKCKAFIQQVKLVRNEGEYFLESAASKALPHPYFDTEWIDEEIDNGMMFAFCLVVASVTPYKYSGLIVVPDGDEDFRREGIWKFDVKPQHMSEKKFEKERKKWFDACQVTTVVIK